MKMKLRVTGSIAAIGVATLVMAGCSPGDLVEKAVGSAVEKGIEGATGADIDLDEDGGNLSIKTDEGEMSFGAGAELPEGFPEADVPLVDGEIMTSMRIKDETTDGFSVSLTVEGDIADVHGEAADLLVGAGFESTSETDMGEMRSGGFGEKGDIGGIVLTSMADTEAGTVMVGYIVTMKVPE